MPPKETVDPKQPAPAKVKAAAKPSPKPQPKVDPARRDEYIKAALQGLASNAAAFPKAKGGAFDAIAESAVKLADAALAKAG